MWLDGKNSARLEKIITLLEGTRKISCAPRPREKSSDFIVAWVRPTSWPRRVSWIDRGQLWLTVGTRTLVAEVEGSTHWHELSRRPPLTI